MRLILLIAIAGILFTSCSNSASTKTFCDTTCVKDSIQFKGEANLGQNLVIRFTDCQPAYVTWENKWTKRTTDLSEFSELKLNPSFVECAFQDTVAAWLSFNNCVNGRGYLLKLPYSEANPIGRYKAALNRFDKKFSVDPELRAYTDGGNIYVVNVKTGKAAEMTFKEAYQVDYDKIHDVIDSINISKSRIFVKLLKEGKDVPLEKQVSL
jgi:hypothetical protein